MKSESHKLPKSLTTVTTFSKWLALYLFILLPSMGFYFGMEYQKQLNTSPNSQQIFNQKSFSTSVPSQTSNWQTYTNTQYNYSVKYPPENIPNEITDNDTHLDFVSFGNPSEKQNIWFSISVSPQRLEGQVKLEKWASEHVLVTLVKETNIIKDGYRGVRLDYEPQRPDIGDPDTIIVISNGEYSYTLSSRTDTIDQILSTFRFSDSSQTISELSPQDFINQLPQIEPEVTWREATASSYFVNTDKVTGKEVTGIMRSVGGETKEPTYVDVTRITDQLTKDGWKNFTIADMPMRTDYTYTKTIGGKQQVVQINTHDMTEILNQDPPFVFAACPCPYSVEVFYSDPF